MLHYRRDNQILQRCAALLCLLGISTAGQAQFALPKLNAQQPTKQVKPLPQAKRPAQAQIKAEEPTSELLIFLTRGTDRKQFERDYGLTWVRTLISDPDAHVFRAASPNAAETSLRRIAPTRFQSMMPVRHPKATGDAPIRAAYLNRRTQNVPNAFVPNDPLFPKDTPTGTTLNYGQWHLVNQHVAGRDAGVQGAWNRDITGQGVLIGIIDDGIETAHPDLAPNYAAEHSYDFGQGDADPNPVYGEERHGISVAGVAAARGGNGIGGTGAAPYAGLAALRIDYFFQTAAMFVDATLYHSSGDNTAIKIKNHSYSSSFPYTDRIAQSDAFSVSADSGTIHIQSAGNYRGTTGQDSNTQMTMANPAVIPVAAMGSGGKYASYSNFGACVFVTAPSSSFDLFRVTTTDRTGSLGYNGFPTGYEAYTPSFGGTSSAAPLVAGVMALGKQVQPNLDGRFAKHLLARTSVVVDADDATVESGGGWKTNGAGLKFNQNYGFGLINADAFTRMATEYTGVTPLEQEEFVAEVSLPIPDNNQTGISQFATLNSTTPLEEMLVSVNITHTYRGDIEISLTSPQGTTSRLVKSNEDADTDLDWTFRSNAFWGEIPRGQWKLTVKDVAADSAGTWHLFSLKALMGKLTGKAYYVDKAHTGTEAGTQQNPYRTVTAALNAIPASEQSARIFIKAGNYGTDKPRVTKRVQFVNWGNTGRARIGKP